MNFIKRLVIIFSAVILMLSFLSVSVFGKVVIDSMDTGEDWYGGRVVNGSIMEGDGAYYCSSDELLLAQRVFTTPMDLSALESGHVLHVWIFIENADLLSGNGQFEITSSGQCDVEETSWMLTKNLFKTGWNDLTFSLNQAGEMSADLTRINFIRFYQFVEGTNSWMIDEISIGERGDFVISEENANEDSDDNNSGGSGAGSNNSSVELGPINKYMYYVIIAISALFIGAVYIIILPLKKTQA